MKCKLCQEKEANQTGSHIFTHALISVCVNEEGAIGRDKETMFSISSEGKVDVFFGRNVSSAKIEEIKGGPLSDEDISANKNGLIIDNFFCINCEKLFGKVESSFSSTLKSIRTNGKLEIEKNIELRLYFLIQAWRASVCRLQNWKLNTNFEERLRRLILAGCSGLDKIPSEVEDELLKTPMIVTYMETDNSCSTTNTALIPDNIEPSLILLCDFILQLFETTNLEEVKPRLFFNLNTVDKHKPINYMEDNFKLGFMTNIERISLIRNFNQQFAGSAMDAFIGQFVQYCRAYAVEPNSYLIALFATELVKDDVPLGERYSTQRVKSLSDKILRRMY